MWWLLPISLARAVAPEAAGPPGLDAPALLALAWSGARVPPGFAGAAVLDQPGRWIEGADGPACASYPDQARDLLSVDPGEPLVETRWYYEARQVHAAEDPDSPPRVERTRVLRCEALRASGGNLERDGAIGVMGQRPLTGEALSSAVQTLWATEHSSPDGPVIVGMTGAVDDQSLHHTLYEARFTEGRRDPCTPVELWARTWTVDRSTGRLSHQARLERTVKGGCKKDGRDLRGVRACPRALWADDLAFVEHADQLYLLVGTSRRVQLHLVLPTGALGAAESVRTERLPGIIVAGDLIAAGIRKGRLRVFTPDHVADLDLERLDGERRLLEPGPGMPAKQLRIISAWIVDWPGPDTLVAWEAAHEEGVVTAYDYGLGTFDEDGKIVPFGQGTSAGPGTLYKGKRVKRQIGTLDGEAFVVMLPGRDFLYLSPSGRATSQQGPAGGVPRDEVVGLSPGRYLGRSGGTVTAFDTQRLSEKEEWVLTEEDDPRVALYQDAGGTVWFALAHMRGVALWRMGPQGFGAPVTTELFEAACAPRRPGVYELDRGQ